MIKNHLRILAHKRAEAQGGSVPLPESQSVAGWRRELRPRDTVPGSGLSTSLPLCSATCWSKWKEQLPSFYYEEPNIHGPSQTLEGTPGRAGLWKLLTWNPPQAAEAKLLLLRVRVGIVPEARGEEFPGEAIHLESPTRVRTGGPWFQYQEAIKGVQLPFV